MKNRNPPESSWPTGVTSLNDAYKFARLICGPDATVKNYAKRLPHETEKSFLLFVRGGCKIGSLSGIGSCIEQLHGEVRTNEETVKMNTQNPQKAIEVRGKKKDIHYYSAQLTDKNCTCRVVFGGDKHHCHISTSCQNWEAGERFKDILDSTLAENSREFPVDAQPVWLKKAWHAVLNRNNHWQNHGIDYHIDSSPTYEATDPIVSFSFGRGGVLTLKSRPPQKTKESMLFQEDGDVLILAGCFQQEFEHGVPSRDQWEHLYKLVVPDDKHFENWELVGFQNEIQDHKNGGDKPDMRLNCTLRWHARHFKHCPWHFGEEVLRGIKRERSLSKEREECPQQDRHLRLAVQTLKSLWDHHCSVKNELDLLKSWSIGGTYIAQSPRMSLESVFKTVQGKMKGMCQVSDTLKAMGYQGYEPDFSLYFLVRLACVHLQKVYEYWDELKVPGERTFYFTPITGSQLQASLNNSKDGPIWQKYLLNHTQVSHLLAALDAEETMAAHQLAVKMNNVTPGILPEHIKVLQKERHKKHAGRMVLQDAPRWSADALLFIKAVEIGYVPLPNQYAPAPTRLQTRQDTFEKVFTQNNKHLMIRAARGLLNRYMSLLQVLDSHRHFQNKGSSFPSERYNIFIWAAAGVSKMAKPA